MSVTFENVFDTHIPFVPFLIALVLTQVQNLWQLYSRTVLKINIGVPGLVSLVSFFSQWILQSADRSTQKEMSSKEKAWFNLGNSYISYYLFFMRSDGSLSGRRCWQWYHYYLFNFVFSLLTRLQTPLSVRRTCMFTTLSPR